MFQVEAELAEPDGAIKPGMTADVRIQLEARSGVITLPIEAVVKAGERSRVTRVQQDASGEWRSEQVEVTLGARNDREVEVTSGLAEGDFGATLISLGVSCSKARAPRVPRFLWSSRRR